MITGMVDAFEMTLRVSEIAQLWRMSETVVYRLFRDEPGVVKLGPPTRLLSRRKRRYFALQIPESVATAVYRRLQITR